MRGGAARVEDDPTRSFCRDLHRLMLERVDPLAVDGAHALPEGLLGDLAALGVFGVSIPERFGGSELGLAGTAAVVETLARRDRSVATTVGLHLGLGTRGLVLYGTEAQRGRWLPDLASGRRLAAFATTEPGAGSDLSRLQTTARRDAVTGRLRIDGQKAFVTNGRLARTFTIACATVGLGEARTGQNLLVLEREDGVESGAEEQKLGLRGSSTTPLYLDGVVVDDDRVLGTPGAGHGIIGEALAYGRTAMAAGCNGTAITALELAARHVAQRRQFGKTLSEQPVVRAQLAEMAASLHVMRALVAWTGAAEHDPATLERRSVAAKVFCSDGDWAICDTALQLLGGSGYIEESGVALLLRDARITRIFEGANDVLLTRLGSLEMAAPAPAPAAGADPGAAAIATLCHELRAAWLARYGLKILRDPVRLHRLGRLAMLREAAEATAASPGPTADPLRAHALARLVTLAEDAARPGPDHQHVDAIVDGVLEQVQR